MVDRVLLGHIGGGKYGLKVSRPGFDVNVAQGAQLAFDSAFNGVCKVFMTLVYSSAQNTPSGFIAFGRTFNNPPPVIYMDRRPAQLGVEPKTEYSINPSIGRTIVDYRSDYYQGYFRNSVTTTGIAIQKWLPEMSVIVLDVEQ